MIVHSLLRGGPARPARGRSRSSPPGGRSSSSACAARRRPAEDVAGRRAHPPPRRPAPPGRRARRLPARVPRLPRPRRCGRRSRLHRRERFALVQVHSLPDFLVFAALPLRLVGVPVLLDLHEAMPEFFRSRFPGASNPLAHRLLLLQERLSIAFSTATLTVNEAMRDRLLGLGVPPDKVVGRHQQPVAAAVRRRGPPAPRVPRGRPRCGSIYAGGLTPTYEVDVAVRAVAALAAGAARPRRPRSTSTAAATPRPALRALADRARHRRAGDVPRPHPDRGRAGGGRRARTSGSPRPGATGSPT